MTGVQTCALPISGDVDAVALGLGIDITRQNQSNVGRPIRIVEKTAQPIKEIVA